MHQQVLKRKEMNKLIYSLIGITFLLYGCSKEPSSCSDPSTVEAISDLIHETFDERIFANTKSKSKDLINVSIDLHRPTAYNKETLKRECLARASIQVITNNLNYMQSEYQIYLKNDKILFDRSGLFQPYNKARHQVFKQAEMSLDGQWPQNPFEFDVEYSIQSLENKPNHSYYEMSISGDPKAVYLKAVAWSADRKEEMDNTAAEKENQTSSQESLEDNSRKMIAIKDADRCTEESFCIRAIDGGKYTAQYTTLSEREISATRQYKNVCLHGVSNDGGEWYFEGISINCTQARIGN